MHAPCGLRSHGLIDATATFSGEELHLRPVVVPFGFAKLHQPVDNQLRNAPLAGALLGGITSQESLALDGRLGGAPQHGELILAFDPCFFSRRDADADQASAERLFQAIAGQGARLPSQRRFEARARSLARGVFVARALHQDILSLMA